MPPGLFWRVASVVALAGLTADGLLPNALRGVTGALALVNVLSIVGDWRAHHRKLRAERTARLTALATGLRRLIAARERAAARPSGLDRADEG